VYGFVKLAIQTNAPLVPVYTFGESLSMGPDWVPFFPTRKKLSYLINAPIRFVSLCQRWFVPFPNGALVTVVGDAIDPGPPENDPSRDRVGKLHAAYVDALLKLIERTKSEAGYPTQKTVIV
jgi:2-acylglycerol O-acyltransferase 2